MILNQVDGCLTADLRDRSWCRSTISVTHTRVRTIALAMRCAPSTAITMAIRLAIPKGAARGKLAVYLSFCHFCIPIGGVKRKYKICLAEQNLQALINQPRMHCSLKT